MAGGRPPLLTAEVEKRLLTALRTGNTRDTSARYAGISVTTLQEWLRRGRDPEYTRGGKLKAGEERYVEFVEAVTRAEAECEANYVGVILKAATERDVTETTLIEEDRVVGTGDKAKVVKLVKKTTTTRKEYDWRPAAWYLERRRADAYGRRDKLALGSDPENPLKVSVEREELKALPPEEIARLYRERIANPDS